MADSLQRLHELQNRARAERARAIRRVRARIRYTESRIDALRRSGHGPLSGAMLLLYSRLSHEYDALEAARRSLGSRNTQRAILTSWSRPNPSGSPDPLP